MTMMLDENGNIITPGMIRAQQKQELDEESSGQADAYRTMALKNNMVHMNKMPVKCVICGSGNFADKGSGAYECLVCGETSYDSYALIKKYIDEHGLHSIEEVSDGSGVSKDIVRFYVQEHKLSVVPADSNGLSCESCGDSISSGFLCDKCKRQRLRGAMLSQRGGINFNK